MSEKKFPTVLIILDGWGYAPPSASNAISVARTPVMDRLYADFPWTTLGATGLDVGLEEHQMSGSEAGHNNIGAGRIILQDSRRISEKIKNGIFFNNPALTGALRHVEMTRGNLHVMGLMGNADSPHANPEHLRALLKLAKKNGVKEVYCHLFTDGRDSYSQSALTHLRYFKIIMAEEGIGKIASVTGRFYAMDRAKKWERMMDVYDVMVFGRGKIAKSPEAVIREAYDQKLTDEYILPTIISEDGQPVAKISKGDSVIFYNLRSDRARQFAKLFVAINKERIIADDMPIIDKIENLYFVAMTDFGPDLSINTAFPSHQIAATLPMVMKDYRQLYIAEMEKYAHLTYFFNGGYPDPVGGEERITVPSPRVSNYAKAPEMSAGIITEKVVKYIQQDAYDFIALNFANADMVGHTGDFKATVKAVEFLDAQVGKIAKALSKKNGTLIVTADHGNADCMLDVLDGREVANTFHTKNPVPFILVSEKYRHKKLKEGRVLGNIAPTVLEIMDIEKPQEMSCDSLIY